MGKKRVEAPERLASDVDAVMHHLAARFLGGLDSLPVDDPLPDGRLLGAVVDRVWICIQAGEKPDFGAAVRDAFETMACVLSNNLEEFYASEGTDEHGALEDVVSGYLTRSDGPKPA